MEIVMENTYWNHKGTHQALIEKLYALVPVSGEIKGSKNKALERFRKASNAYYDIFNNGGWNRGQSISKFFGSSVTFELRRLRENPRYARLPEVNSWNRIHQSTEPKMDEIILAAAKEQGIA